MSPHREPEPVGLFIVGGGFVGLWIVLTLMTRPEWLWWGLLGLGIGAGLYAGKIVTDQARYVVWTLVGVSIGCLIGLALLAPHSGMLATLITLTGAAFLAGGLPARGTAAFPGATATAEADGVRSGWSPVRTAPPADEPVVVAQSGPYGQQQSVTVLRR